jgi:tetratricopeptide (TPR) repeat protein
MATTADLFNLALQHHQAGNLHQAEGHYYQVLQADPYHADAMHLLGVLAAQVGQFERAAECHRRALQLAPHVPGYHFDLAIAYRRLGRRTEAIESYQQTVRLQPDNVGAHNNLGNALREEGRLEEAIRHYRLALQYKPDFADGYNNLGNALYDLGRLDEAEANYREAIRLNPEYVAAHSNLGVVLADLGRWEEAVASDRLVLRWQPDNAGAHNNLGHVLTQLARFDDAVAHLHEALRLDPGYVDARNNLGVALHEQGNLDEARIIYDQVLEMQPDHVDAHFNRGLLRLLSGDLERGWSDYEWRERRKDYRKRTWQQPRWDGSALAGRTILVYAEQGLGDSLQFIRYAPLLQERGGRVLVECPPVLAELLATCPGVERVIPTGSPLPAFDFQAPLLSLPGLCRTTLATIPANIPYLRADPQRAAYWRDRLDGFTGFKIGIAWQGSRHHKGDHLRSFALAQFTPLTALPGIRLFSLQKGPGTEQLENMGGGLPVTDLGTSFAADSLMDAAAAMTALDLIITVDSALAHLAGALGLPVWVALPFAPDFRWMREREDSPWYPRMRLFRQARVGDWDDVFQRITGAVKDRLTTGAKSHCQAHPDW